MLFIIWSKRGMNKQSLLSSGIQPAKEQSFLRVKKPQDINLHVYAQTLIRRFNYLIQFNLIYLFVCCRYFFYNSQILLSFKHVFYTSIAYTSFIH